MKSLLARDSKRRQLIEDDGQVYLLPFEQFVN